MIQPLRNTPSCDHFQAPSPYQARNFLAANISERLPFLGGLPMPENGDAIQRGAFHLDPTAQSKIWTGNETAWLNHVVLVDHLRDGRFFVRMSALRDHQGQQLAFFYRQDERAPWMLAHGHAWAESDYQTQVMNHDPIMGARILHANKWGQPVGGGAGRLTLDRWFINAGTGKAHVLTVHVFDQATNTLASAWMPEDTFILQAILYDTWKSNAQALYGQHHGVKGSYIKTDSMIEVLAPHIDAVDGRFSVNKYGEAITGPKILDGAYTDSRLAPFVIAPLLGDSIPSRIAAALKQETPTHAMLLSQDALDLFQRNVACNLSPRSLGDFMAHHGHHLYPLPWQEQPGEKLWSIHRVTGAYGKPAPAIALPYVTALAGTTVAGNGKLHIRCRNPQALIEPALLVVHTQLESGSVSGALILRQTQGAERVRKFGPAIGALQL
ncbi:MAG: hypothetical protein IPI58_05190 [Alphaproteobacteria bacterium]|nr:MAG: hypothetical protein IPI58_05190 [Alphaproteobacteria bacterium]